jgi:hypothetical protein
VEVLAVVKVALKKELEAEADVQWEVPLMEVVEL